MFFDIYGQFCDQLIKEWDLKKDHSWHEGCKCVVYLTQLVLELLLLGVKYGTPALWIIGFDSIKDVLVQK